MASKEFARGFAAAVGFVSKTLNLKEGTGSSYQLKRLQLDADHGMLPDEVQAAEAPVLPAPRAVTSEGPVTEGEAPPKRTRRSKAQIEADKLAAEHAAG